MRRDDNFIMLTVTKSRLLEKLYQFEVLHGHGFSLFKCDHEECQISIIFQRVFKVRAILLLTIPLLRRLASF